MDKSIRAMIKEYEEKVADQDILLKAVEEDIRVIRETRDCKFNTHAIMGIDDLRQDRKLINARRQAYVQAKADFNSLIGEL